LCCHDTAPSNADEPGAAQFIFNARDRRAFSDGLGANVYRQTARASVPARRDDAIAVHGVDFPYELKLDERLLGAVPVKDTEHGPARRSPPPETYYLGEAVAVEVRYTNGVYSGFRLTAVHLPENAGT
jgi:hypothetical protein